ncbi:GGDEF domain-containing protein [Helicovermis profundi]|uniref:Diguanylate cyclase n=1 Tax=Helicovermis profundi TaxID=3065157 RepID=A0AAU9EKN3_9FIRM|nr:diguanylate cyclase [Clostridia bacterium S502]
MKQHIIKLNNVIIILLTVIYLTVLTIIIPSINYNFFDYVIVTLVYFSSLVSLLISLTTGLILSLIFLIFIGGFISFEYFNSLLKKDFINYTYIILLPIVSIITGVVRNKLKTIENLAIPIEQERKELIRIDNITGFRNSKDFYLNLDEEMKRAIRYKHVVSLLLVKISHFEEFSAMHSETSVINTFISLSKAIENITRNVDKPYRIKSDIFAVILPNTNQEGANIVKKRLTEVVQKNNIIGNVNEINFEIKVGALEYDKQLENSILYKKACEKELEYDN